MTIKSFKYFSLIFLLLSLISCVAQPQQSHLIGECKQLKEDHLLLEGRAGAYAGEKMLSVSDKTRVGRMKAIGTIVSGTKVKISSILKNSDGSYGRFLRVEVEVLEGPYAGVKADVPACVPYHPSLKWVTNCTLEADNLTFNSDLVASCD